MPNSNDELVTRLSKIISLKKSSLPQKKRKPKIDKEKEKEFIKRLKEIASKVAAGIVTSEDLKEAREINDSLGGGYSSLIAAIENMIHSEEGKKAQTIEAHELSDPVAASKDYFKNNIAVRESEKTLRDIEAGKDISEEKLIQTIESLTSKEDRQARETFIKELAEKKHEIFKRAIIENRASITEEERRNIAEIDQQRLKHMRRSTYDKGITSIIGESKASKLLPDQVIKNKSILQNTIRELSGSFRQVEHLVAKENHQLNQHLTEILASGNINGANAIGAIINATKEAIIKVDAVAVAKAKEQIVKASEAILTDASTKAAVEDGKAKDEAKDETSLSARLAAKEIRKAILLKANSPISTKIENVNAGSSIYPEHTPSSNAKKKTAALSKG